MEFNTVESPSKELIDFFDKRIEEFNVVRWEIKEKVPLVVKVTNDAGVIVAGAAGKTFGTWLLLDNLWVNESLRGQDIGSKILAKMELASKERGCRYVLLETLDFQARPFYEKYGYRVQWVQNNYPREGRKHFMMKEII
jgi:GNAT superfamily N-acetyltransferase